MINKTTSEIAEEFAFNFAHLYHNHGLTPDGVIVELKDLIVKQIPLTALLDIARAAQLYHNHLVTKERGQDVKDALSKLPPTLRQDLSV